MTRFDDVSSTRQGKCSQFRETWATAKNGGSSAGVGPERLPNVLPLTICTWPPAASQSGCEQTAHTFTSPVQTLLSPFQQPIRECVFIVFRLHSGLTWPPSYKPSLSPTLSTPGIWLGTVLCGGDDQGVSGSTCYLSSSQHNTQNSLAACRMAEAMTRRSILLFL